MIVKQYEIYFHLSQQPPHCTTAFTHTVDDCSSAFLCLHPEFHCSKNEYINILFLFFSFAVSLSKLHIFPYRCPLESFLVLSYDCMVLTVWMYSVFNTVNTQQCIYPISWDHDWVVSSCLLLKIKLWKIIFDNIIAFFFFINMITAPAFDIHFWFLTNTESCNHNHNQDVEPFSHPQISPRLPFCYPPHSWQPLLCSLYLQLWLSHKSGFPVLEALWGQLPFT